MKKSEDSHVKHNTFPVDRGWAWIVCAACMVETFIMAGVLKSYGIFFIELSSTFKASSSTVSMMLSIQSITGSFIAYLVLTVGELCFSNRTFIMFGAVLSSLAFFLTAFASTMSAVMFLQGAVFGIGFACINGPAVVMIGKYFEKRRGFANSMLKVGGALGSLILAPFYRFLLDEFALGGTFMIVAGLLLHIIPCGALARPPEFYQRAKHVLVKKGADESQDKQLKKPMLKNSENINNENIKNGSIQVNSVTAILQSQRHSFNSEENGMSLKETVYMPERNQNGKLDHHLSYDRLFPKKDIVRLMRTFSENPDMITADQKLHSSKHKHTFGSSVINALSKSSVALYGGVGETYGSVGNIQTENKIQDNSDNNIYSDECCFRIRHVTWSEVYSRMLAFKLLKNKLFLLLIPSAMLSIIGFALILTYIPPHAKDIGIDDTNIALLVSIVSGTDLIGKFITAFISDNEHIKKHFIFLIPMLITGFVCHLIPLFTEFWSLALFSAIYGLCGGFYLAIMAIVIVDFVGVKNMSSAVGIMLLSHGIAKASATPLIGYLRDVTGSYVAGFHFTGACLLIGGLILLLEPFARRWEAATSKDNDIEQS